MRTTVNTPAPKSPMAKKKSIAIHSDNMRQQSLMKAGETSIDEDSAPQSSPHIDSKTVQITGKLKIDELMLSEKDEL